VTRSCSPESRTAYQRLLSQGWTDALRALHLKEPMYTFWEYMRNRWERDSGLRLEHILLSSVLTKRLQGVGVDRHVRGREIDQPTDLAPRCARGSMLRPVSALNLQARGAALSHPLSRSIDRGVASRPELERDLH
jgi:hypothetical protein